MTAPEPEQRYRWIRLAEKTWILVRMEPGDPDRARDTFGRIWHLPPHPRCSPLELGPWIEPPPSIEDRPHDLPPVEPRRLRSGEADADLSFSDERPWRPGEPDYVLETRQELNYWERCVVKLLAPLTLAQAIPDVVAAADALVRARRARW